MLIISREMERYLSTGIDETVCEYLLGMLKWVMHSKNV
jgi:hypothetical protein